MKQAFQTLLSLLATLPGLTAASVCSADEADERLLDGRWNAIAVSDAHAKANQEADPHSGSSTWLAGSPEDQLRAETSLDMLSRGGIFVPTMTNGMSEPKFRVRSTTDDETVAEGFTGSIVYVPGGDYSVSIGSMNGNEPLEFDVHVVEGATTVIPVEWSGLQIKVVDERSSMIRGNYEIVSLPERAYVGLGTGALVNEGERMNTWLLWPGKYMILSAGESYQARKNFITFELKPGELTKIKLVLDENTGDILGGGEIDDGVEIGVDKWWDLSLMVGGAVSFNHTKDYIGKPSGNMFDISAFIDSYFNMLLHNNYLYTRLFAEIGGTIRLGDRPFITTIDELKFQLLYAYRLVDWFGPYVNFSFESNMAPAWQEFSNNVTITTHDENGDIVSTETNKLEAKLGPSFSPITIKAGGGGRFDATVGTWFRMNARLGITYRDVITRDLFVVSDYSEDDARVMLSPVASQSQVGAELALNFDLTPVRWFTLKLDASVIEPFMDWKKPIVDLDADAAFRISSIASISYALRLNYDPKMLDKIQWDHYLRLRFSYKIL